MPDAHHATPSTLVALLDARARQTPDFALYTLLGTDGRAQAPLTCAALNQAASAVASALVGTATPVMVVLPTGYDFLAAFLGCLRAGVIAIPTRYPNPKRPLDHLRAVATDSGAGVGITTVELLPAARDQLPGIHWRTPGDLAAGPAGATAGPATPPRAEDIAYLQYTSGSTSAPRGVVIRHAQIMANSADFARRFAITPAARTLSWLPHYHDLGLVFGCLQPLFVGCAGHIMPPGAFAQRPLTWLEALSRHAITHTGAPNFAYQASADIPPAQLEGLDLSALQVAINGAEPVRADTLAAFTAAYAPAGLRPEALCPGYGLAEATLVATGCGPHRAPVVRQVRESRQSNGAQANSGGADNDGANGDRLEAVTTGGRALVSSGPLSDPAATGTRILIVDPDSRHPLPEGALGEIWLAGPSIAEGYWRREAATAAKFQARLADGDGPFLRTGDLGGGLDGELFVLGRIDDMIILHGANHAAEDIELTVENADPALQPGGGAAFTLELAGENRLVVAQEVRRPALRGLDGERLCRTIIAAVAELHGLEVAAVALLKPRGLPRTHSGKKQRHACRKAYQEGALPVVASHLSPRLRPTVATTGTDAMRPDAAGAATPDADGGMDRAAALRHWLRDYAATRLNSRLMDERRAIPPHVVLDLGNRGVLGLQAPQTLGGLGLGNRALAATLEQLAALDTTLASFVAVNNALGVRPILRHAGPALRDDLLPALASGRQLASFAMTEAGAGSNIRTLAATGRADGAGGWRLHGVKLWSGSAAWAGVINTFVRLEDIPTAGGGADGGGVTGFVVRQGRPGLRMGPEALTMGLRAMVQNEVRLEGVRVAPEDMLGRPGQGMDVAMDTMAFGRYAIAALSLGVMKRCLQLMVRHGTRRAISTGRLIDNPAILTRISDLTAAVDAVGALVALVGTRLDADLPVPPDLFCACKTAGPEFAWRAADHLMQQMAGRGYIETNIAPQILRDARVLRIFEGPTEPMNMHIGSRLLQTPDGLCGFIADTLTLPALAAELRAAADALRARADDAGRAIRDPVAARQWAYLQAGEVATYAILLAAATQAQGDGRAVAWARRRFDRRLAKALSGGAAEAVFLDAGAALAVVAGYSDSIGEVDQTLAGEDWTPDPLIAPLPAPGTGEIATPLAPPPDPVAAPSDGTGGPTDGAGEVLDFLMQWLARETGHDRATMAPDDRLGAYGLDSVAAVLLAGALEQRFGGEMAPTLVWDHPTLAALAAHVAATRPGATRPATSPCKAPVPPLRDELSLLAEIDTLDDAALAALAARLTGAE